MTALAEGLGGVPTRWAPEPGLRYGSEQARIFTRPLRELTPDTSLGFEVIEFAWTVLGVDLLPYQRWLFIHALELHPTVPGRLRFRTVLVLVARQNGKTLAAMVLGLWALYVQQTRLVLGTAQELSLAEEVWGMAVEIAEDAERYPDLAAEVKRVVRVNGNKSLELVNRSRWQVKASNRRAGRGRTAGLLMLDELREHTSWEAWGALSKTTLAVADALIWCTTNAGDAASLVLRHLRRMAHLALGDPDGEYRGTGETLPVEDGMAEDDLAIFEWSAWPGAQVWDRDAWAAANPALGHTITERAIASAVRTDPAPVALTEVLCQWLTSSRTGPFPGSSWQDGQDPTSSIPADARVVYCVAVSRDRSYATVAVAGLRADGRTHVEVAARRAGTGWVAPWFAARADPAAPLAVVVQSASAPVASLAEDIGALEGVQAVTWAGRDLGIGCALLYDLVAQEPTLPPDASGQRRPHLVHLPQPVLDVAAATATSRPAGDMWVWRLTDDGEDTAPLVAATGAVWGLHRGAPDTRSAYEAQDLLVV